MRTAKEVIDFCRTLEDTYQDMPFHDDTVVFRRRSNHKIFVLILRHNHQLILNVKVDPDWIYVWREMYEAVYPGYHMNKNHWNSIRLDGTVPRDEIERMIGESYFLVAPKTVMRKRKKKQGNSSGRKSE